MASNDEWLDQLQKLIRQKRELSSTAKGRGGASSATPSTTTTAATTPDRDRRSRAAAKQERSRIDEAAAAAAARRAAAAEAAAADEAAASAAAARRRADAESVRRERDAKRAAEVEIRREREAGRAEVEGKRRERREAAEAEAKRRERAARRKEAEEADALRAASKAKRSRNASAAATKAKASRSGVPATRAVKLGRGPSVSARDRPEIKMGPRERAALQRGADFLNDGPRSVEECVALDLVAVDEFFHAALGHSMVSHSEACVLRSLSASSESALGLGRRHEEILNTVAKRLLEVTSAIDTSVATFSLVSIDITGAGLADETCEIMLSLLMQQSNAPVDERGIACGVRTTSFSPLSIYLSRSYLLRSFSFVCICIGHRAPRALQRDRFPHREAPHRGALRRASRPPRDPRRRAEPSALAERRGDARRCGGVVQSGASPRAFRHAGAR